MATTKVIKKAPASKKEAPKKEAPKKEVKKATPQKVEKAKPTVYHVSKRDNEGREWKVFIETSDKVIKLFKTQQEALSYAQSLAKNKNDGSSVRLHGLDGKMRRY
ncbi:MAG: DUF2188 domain-containing protein [Acholeplasmatales bacterium]|nr:DUF2188 domain-containing protein [Acholeplasmatales bacterium]